MKYMDLFYLKSDTKLTKILSIIDAIKNRENNKIKKPNEFLTRHYQNWLKTLDGLDKGYSVNNDCIGCKICKDICPVKNIEMVDKKPKFNGHCEQCCACLQYCQKKGN
jgi:ferredoxin